MSVIADARSRIRAWRDSPARFVRECLGVTPDAWQDAVLEAYPTNQRMALKACKGPGKSALLSWLGWHFLATRPHPKVACTSITGDNLRDGLWTEFAHWQHRSPFLQAAFEWGKERIVARDHPDTWWAAARSWSRGADSSQQAHTLAGLHADHVLFILDEAGGIPDAVMAAAEGGLANAVAGTGREGRLLMAGNPTHLEGPLYRACTSERHLWHVTEITSDPDDPKRTPRVSAQWAREQIDKYGRDNPWVLVNVFGQFPPSSLNALIGPDDINPALKRQLRITDYEFAPRVLGVDVARFGDDRTVIFPRQGLAAFKPVVMRGANTGEIAARVAQAQEKFKADAVFVDDTGGWGAGVIDNLGQAGYAPIPVNFSGKANDSRYLNKRAEMHFLAAEWVKKGGALPNLPELVREATAPTYDFQGGKFRIEAKDQIKDRLGSSPDLWDAFVLTFAQPVAPRTPSYEALRLTRPGRALIDFDPHADT